MINIFVFNRIICINRTYSVLIINNGPDMIPPTVQLAQVSSKMRTLIAGFCAV